MTKAIRIWTAINWTLGSVLLMLTLVGPIYFEHVHLKAGMTAARRTVEAIAAFEREQLVQSNRYVAFGPAPGGLPQGLASLGLNEPSRHDFRYEANFQPNGNLEIRATTKTSAIRDRWIPPLEYRYELTSLGAEASSGWLANTGRSFGLLGLF